MSGNLTKDLGKIINKNVEQFLGEVASKYNLNKEELMDVWKEHQGVKAKPKRKPNAYVIFSSHHRAGIKEDHPGLKMTEITKKLSEMWGALTQEEKNQWKSK